MSSAPHTRAALSALMDEVAQQHYPASALYVIATPIGNVGDISLRALHVLSMVDAVACEDTRNTGTLLSRYGLSKSLIAAHEHNERQVADRLISRLQAGDRIALVSDAGTPGISDPGARIVDSVIDAGVRVIPIPGASAPVAALCASGLTQHQFLFVGFLPTTASQRKQQLAKYVNTPSILVFLEAPHRIAETLKALLAAFGPERQIVIAREISKLFEELHRCPLGDALPWLTSHPNHEKGEFVLLLAGADEDSPSQKLEAERMLGILLAELPVSQATSLVARITGQKKNALYKRALEMTSDKR